MEETLSPAAVEPAQPAIEPTDDNQPAAELETPASGEGVQEPVEEFDSIDYDGKQYQVPKALKPGFMMNSDYTQKTQALSERNRELDAREQRIAQQSQFAEQERKEWANLAALDMQLSEYENVDWDKWEQEAPLDAQSGWRKYQQLAHKRQAMTAELSAKQNERSREEQRSSARRLEETYAAAQKIPGWTPEVGQKIADYAASKGVPQDMIKASITPGLYGILYDAWIGSQTLKKQASPPKLQQSQAQPTQTVGGKSNPSGPVDLASADMEAYVAARKKQLEARR